MAILDAIARWFFGSLKVDIADLMAWAEKLDVDKDGAISVAELIEFLRKRRDDGKVH
mgnify:CR=1 FL=1|jgi:hypothetical protein